MMESKLDLEGWIKMTVKTAHCQYFDSGHKPSTILTGF